MAEIQSAGLTKGQMKAILEGQNYSVFAFSFPKVSQKSYGNEKRYIYPPPLVELSGKGWKPNESRERPQRATSTSPGLFNSTASTLDDSTDSLNIPDVAIAEQSLAVAVVTCDGKGRNQWMNFVDGKASELLDNTFFMPATDRGNYIQLDCHLSKLFQGRWHTIGSLHSSKIKRISKPSNKKKVDEEGDEVIKSGGRIAVFNRLRSGFNVNPVRYLDSGSSGFFTSTSHWKSFIIYSMDPEEAETTNFEASEGVIRYGDTVKLVDPETMIALPRMIIRKAEKAGSSLVCDEYVAQLHKVSFALKDRNQSRLRYLAAKEDSAVDTVAAKGLLTDMGGNVTAEAVDESAVWTVVGVDTVECRFFNLTSLQPVTPGPVVVDIIWAGGGDRAQLYLKGANFTPHLQAWFADVSVVTVFRNEELLLCAVPDTRLFSGVSSGNFEAPLSLVRSDGVVYFTGKTFSCVIS